MATMNLDFGTSIDLEEGEEILCADISEVMRMFPFGCLQNALMIMTLGIYAIVYMIVKPKCKGWRTNLVVTNKRLVSIPLPDPKRKFEADLESYYLTDLTRTWKGNENASATMFSVFTAKKGPGKGKNLEFCVSMKMNAKNLLNAFAKDFAKDDGMRVNMQTGGVTWVKPATQDFSGEQHAQKAAYLMNIIDDAIAKAKA